jgi:hypothetical protein
MHGWKVYGEGASPENCDPRRTESIVFSDLQDEFRMCKRYPGRRESLPRYPKSLRRCRLQEVHCLLRNPQTL